jgi:DNA-binding PadR family transcriptional regulator
VNITLPTTLVLQALASGYHYGFDVMDATGLPSGTVYPILRRLEREKLVDASWEDPLVARAEQRPARRYYALSAAGESLLGVARRRYRMPRANARSRRLKDRPSET